MGECSTPRTGRFTSGKEIRYSLYRRLGKPQGRSGRVRKISPPPVFDPRTVQPVASRYTDCAIPVHLIHVIPFRNYCIQVGARYFSLLKSSGAHPVFWRIGSGSSPYATRSQRAGDHSPPCRVQYVDHNSTPEAGLRGADKDSFFLYYVLPAITYGFSTIFRLNFISPHRTHQLVFAFGTLADYEEGTFRYYACYLFSKLCWSRLGILVYFGSGLCCRCFGGIFWLHLLCWSHLDALKRQRIISFHALR